MSEPTVFNGRYELHRRIARGGMADVFLARDQLLDRPVAVKVLFSEFATNPAFVARFRREAQAAANLNHPNIVSVYDWGQEDNTYFIVMEYVEGRSLHEVIHAEGPLHPRRAADVAADIAAALGFAHRNGVIHRDVKPGNVLLSPTGQVKVTDFGIARAVDAVDDNLTQTGSVIGTASYFSPEQAQGLALGPRSDLYSLGCVLYEAVTGRAPFSGDNPVAVAYKHVQERPIPPRQHNPDVPAELEAIILALLEKDPTRRYPSAEDVRADLGRFRQGQPVLAGALAGGVGAAGADLTRAEGSPTVATPTAGATRTIPAATATAPAATTGGTGTQALGREREEHGRSPRRTWGFVLVLLLLLAVLGGLLFALWRVLSERDDTPALISVPQVEGATEAEARARLEDAGFEVKVTPEATDQIETGRVFDQRPEAGEQAEEGSEVEILVSAGPNSKALPNVLGLSADDARARLEDAGFTNVQTSSEPSSSVPAGEVFDQDPDAGTTTPLNDRIILKVSAGRAVVEVPDVRGKSVVEASTELAQRRFQVASREEPSDTVENGKVIDTNPSAGTRVEEGSTVTMTVSSGPAEATVPDVVGTTEAEARAKLQEAGFDVTVQYEQLDPVHNQSFQRDGRVIRQSPSGGTKARKGSTVTITVGRVSSGD